MKNQYSAVLAILSLIFFPYLLLAQPSNEFGKIQDDLSIFQKAIYKPKNYNFHIGLRGLDELQEKNIIQIERKWYSPEEKRKFTKPLARFRVLNQSPQGFVDAFVMNSSPGYLKAIIEWFEWDDKHNIYNMKISKMLLLGSSSCLLRILLQCLESVI